MSTIGYPTQEAFEEIFNFTQQYEVKGGETDEALVTARHPTMKIRYEAFIGGVKLYEITEGGWYNGQLPDVRKDILKAPVQIKSVQHFAWVLFCKLKQRRELFFKEPGMERARKRPIHVNDIWFLGKEPE